MRKKELNGIAASIAHKFASSAEHFAYLAAQHHCARVAIDLITGIIHPDLFNIDRNQHLVTLCAKNLRTLTAPDTLAQAQLVAHFDSTPQDTMMACGTFTLKLVTTAGQEASGQYENRPQLVCA